MRLSFSERFSTPRQALLLIGWFAVSLVFLRSFIHAPPANATLEPTPYRLDLASWPVSHEQHSRSAFLSSMFASSDIDDDWKPVTAVIHRVLADPGGVASAVRHLLEFPFIQEILIHNGDSAAPLTLEQLGLADPSLARRIEIFEPGSTSEPFGGFARFTTCAMASNDICYFQDDTWTHRAMDSLYTNMVRYPNLIHAIIPPLLYLDHLQWRFSNPGINMHSGFMDLQYGAFVPRWKCQTFLTQLGKSGFGKDQIRTADALFSLWTNQYPWILPGPIYLQPHQSSGNNTLALQTPDQWPAVASYATLSQTVRKLERILEADMSDAPKDYFERVEELPRLDERDVRAPCGNDRCLFISNMDPMPAPTELVYSRQNVTSMQHWEELYNGISDNMPSSSFFDSHAYHLAVDQDSSTCWNTFQYPKEGDYFGLIFIGDQQPNLIRMYTTNTVDRPEQQFRISVTSDGTDWIDCPTANPSAWHVSTEAPSRQVQVHLSCGWEADDIKNQEEYNNETHVPKIPAARAIRFTFLEDATEPFSLCSIEVDDALDL